MSKLEGYPLPWCEKLDAPYWRVNWLFCDQIKGWREWQAKKPMKDIIPEIDRILEAQ